MPDHLSTHHFHPLVSRWFESRFGNPTPIQQKVWPLIANDDHVLIMAPTGSGKTLAAFLWALDRLIRGRWETGQTRLLYVSPLKALNNDVRRNLIQPLTQIRALFDRSGEAVPHIRVATRSGDTPPHERRQMIRRPPEILITTPESLHLMLSSHGGRAILGCIRTVILDEIHAVVGGKRGTLLMSAVDRLIPLCGEFQRIALSATIRPANRVAGFVAGFTLDGDPHDPVYIPRQMKCCRDGQQHREVLHVRIPEAVMGGDATRNIWDELADTFRQTIEKHRATIIFVNSRRLSEKLTFLINADRPRPIAYAHHGSLSKALRLEVEERLKTGSLRAIVATASLELGIDIGDLDQVILVQSPASISSAVQRIGRSGHGVGETSRGIFFATHATDALTAAVLAEAVKEKEIEPVRPVECPLDVLAQVMVSMTGVQSWDMDALYHRLRTSYPFRHLQRKAFDLVVDMLAGRYAATRIEALKPKVAVDRLDNTVTARKGALLALYTSGGVIPDRGYFSLRHQETGARIGELDEEFVWEAKKGQVFTLGTRNWRIQRITHNDVIVRPARPKAPAPPFWRADDADRDFHLSNKIARFLGYAQTHLRDTGFVDTLCSRYHMDGKGARYLMDFLTRQQNKTGCGLPHRHHVVLEQMPAGKGGPAAGQVVIHTLWGGRVNRPFALALAAAWEKRFGHAPSIFPTNDALHLLLPQDVASDEILRLVPSADANTLLREKLEGSGHFGARFRECAARALLLPRHRFNQRMPLWLSRQQSRRLMDAVGRFADFPILLETWRSCLQDDFDMVALIRVLQELENGEIAWTAVKTISPSPMALSGSWRQINQYMYADDRQPGRVKTDLSRDLIREVVFTPELRPAIDTATIDDFQEKRQRLYPGYVPSDSVELLEWVKERLLIPWGEWQRLLSRDTGNNGENLHHVLDPIRKKLLRLIPAKPDDTGRHLIVAAEMAFAITHTLYAGHSDVRWIDLDGNQIQPVPFLNADGEHPMPNKEEIVSQWLRFYGPVSADFIGNNLGLDSIHLSEILSALIEIRTLVSGKLIDGQSAVQICHADNFDTLLRMVRRRRLPAIETREIGELALVLARFQGITGTHSPGDLEAGLQPLMGLALPAGLWETEILPARIDNYAPHHLDHLMQASPLMWIGYHRRKIAFCHEADLDLMVTGPESHPDEDPAVAAAIRLFADHRGRYPLSALLGDPPRPTQDVLALLWAGVWAGRVTNETMIALRRGLAHGVKANATANGPSVTGRAGATRFRRNRSRVHGSLSTGTVGNWRLIERPPPLEGLVEAEELVKDRARLLLDRYGILFRQLLERELPPFQWSAIFRALRLMELSGEITAGCFFNGIPGLQFVSTRMLALLREKSHKTHLFWISALDPASICGLTLDMLKGTLPRRSAGTHLVYLGSRLAMVSRRHGKQVEIRLPVGHPHLKDCFSVFDHLLGRSVDPRRSINIETINDEPGPDSPLLDLLRERFDTIVETKSITLYRRLGTRSGN